MQTSTYRLVLLLLPSLIFGVMSFIWAVHVTSMPQHEETMHTGHIGSEKRRGHWPIGPVHYASPHANANTKTNKTVERHALEKEWSALGTLDPMLRVSPGEEVIREYHHRELYEHGDCIPMQRWQTRSYPNCNSFHELNMRATRPIGTPDTGGTMHRMEELHVGYLGKGSVRTAWKVEFGAGIGIPVVLKTLK